MTLDGRMWLFLYLVATFLTCLLVGDLIGGKLTAVTLGGHEFVFSVGQLSFPLTFVLTDILNEFYGRQVTRRVTFLVFCMIGIAVAVIYAAGHVPWWHVATTADWTGVSPESFERVFTNAMRIQVSSMAAFLIAQLIDISTFFVIKRATGGRFLWLRATGSTAISQLVDTIVITGLVFGDKVTFAQYSNMVLSSYAVKLTAAIAVTPLIYALHELIEKRFGIPPVGDLAPRT